MADLKVIDLLPGHLGTASYDTEENEWKFSQTFANNDAFQQVIPFQECIAPSDVKQVGLPIYEARSNLKWLAKAHPEASAAISVTSELSKAESAREYSDHQIIGTLFAVGRAAAEEKMRSERQLPIFAMLSGSAGHVLRLLLPKKEKRRWTGTSLELCLLDPTRSEKGEWVGTGGTIRQITFAEGTSGPENWLAIRQDNAITIFRPVLLRKQRAHKSGLTPSFLDPNPLVELKHTGKGLKNYVDVSFNPWYSRQFAVIDELGQWSTCDIQGRKQSNYKLFIGKGVEALGDDPDPKLQIAGWFRILWAGSLSTIVVCGRTHVAVYDVTSQPIALRCPKLLATDRPDSILDVKRCVRNLSYVFILTTVRILWLEILHDHHHRNLADQNGFRVVSSSRHFRDTGDDTMKIAASNHGDATLICIYSSRNPIINTFAFTNNNPSARPQVVRYPASSIVGNGDSLSSLDCLQALTITAATLLRNLSVQHQNPHLDYSEMGIGFFQVWASTRRRGLHRSLCAWKFLESTSDKTSRNPILPPTTARYIPSQVNFCVANDYSFIVPDRDAVDDANAPSHDEPRSDTQFSSYLRPSTPSMNWRAIFGHVFREDYYQHKYDFDRVSSTGAPSTMVGTTEQVQNVIRQAHGQNDFALSTLSEIISKVDLLGNLDHATKVLSDLFFELKQSSDIDGSTKLVVSDLIPSPALGMLSQQTHASGNSLMAVYDRLADIWISNLPVKLSGPARLVKHRVIRNVAIELCLSSVAVSRRSNAAYPAPIDDIEVMSPLSISVDLDKLSGVSSSPGPRNHSGLPVPLGKSGPMLPTPNRTPSMYSHNSLDSTVGDIGVENLAIHRLREYAPSIKTQANIGSVTNKCLASWPSTPGADPATYNWTALPTTSFGEDSETDASQRKSGSQWPRRQGTDSFARSERSTEPFSQPTSIATSSQPSAMVNELLGSQAAGGTAIAQSERVHDESRISQGKTAKKKKRRAAGF